MFGKFTVAAVLLTACMLSGCVSPDTKEVSAKDFKPVPGSAGSEQIPDLVAGDALEISVEVDGNMEVAAYQTEISSTGRVTLPLVGDVAISGLSVEEARSGITAAYGKYFVSRPVIIINRVNDLASTEWGFVTVTGAVAQPGRVSIPSAQGIKLTAVISRSGGFAPSAKKSDIRITRKVEDGRKIRVTINYNDIGQDGDADSDISLFQGDIVYVPQRIF
ncbi:polysaccharide biosynthesis/export family protein [Pontiella agarivorans]|uniref:Polysaccharide biosynthesis/export family protein n=1 Tax=Pontiella agarivorans TaxID=3038953 RepID=A0ABU5MU86_9BACT|nr:polysaccharide biosynthesis/export family protein [Pontiella agarivorans]MDZ8117759.1 polysaccharide biosynthesis/export family protein [Pontiella agarivorans]